MSKMAISYIILAVCIMFQTAQADTLSDWVGSLLPSPKKIVDELQTETKLAHVVVNNSLNTLQYLLDQAISKMSQNTQQLLDEDKVLLNHVQKAKPCVKLIDNIRVGVNHVMKIIYDCSLDNLKSLDLSINDWNIILNTLLNILNQDLLNVTKCLNNSTLLDMFTCVLSDATEDVSTIVPLIRKGLNEITKLLNIFPKTAKCLEKSLPQVLEYKHVRPDDINQCLRSAAQLFIC